MLFWLLGIIVTIFMGRFIYRHEKYQEMLHSKYGEPVIQNIFFIIFMIFNVLLFWPITLFGGLLYLAITWSPKGKEEDDGTVE